MTRLELEMAFAGATIGWAESTLELSDPEIGSALGADRKTIQRWRHRKSAPSPRHRQQMEKLNQLRWLLEHAFRTPELGRQWLHGLVPALRGRTPISVLSAGDLDSVIEVLATHYTGAFV